MLSAAPRQLLGCRCVQRLVVSHACSKSDTAVLGGGCSTAVIIGLAFCSGK